MAKKALLISTYEMGRQPFGLASPAAFLSAAGWDVVCADVAKEKLADAAIASADVVGFHLPMHTATRLAAPVVSRVRRANPSARICAYGLYAPLNANWLRSLGVEAIFGGEFEADLTNWADNAPAGSSERPVEARVPRVHFLVPDRRGLPPLSRYATLQLPGGERRTVAYTEGTRGCKHLCRHCPVVPVYNGQFRIVPGDIVLADIEAQVAAGARHVTFGDPDFLNGPTHALRVVDALHAAHPEITYDVTIKVEHLLKHRDVLPRLVDTGCLFVTSAVESIDDRVLAILEKGHTRQDFAAATELCRRIGLTLVPTFVAFHPWLTLDGYCDLLDTLDALGL
ncbi:MAG TPA: radical SAM protein, partial [Vicinamibacterales bacterium]